MVRSTIRLTFIAALLMRLAIFETRVLQYSIGLPFKALIIDLRAGVLIVLMLLMLVDLGVPVANDDRTKKTAKVRQLLTTFACAT